MEYCAKSELHPASAGLGMLKGRPKGYSGAVRIMSSHIAFKSWIDRGADLHRNLVRAPLSGRFC